MRNDEMLKDKAEFRGVDTQTKAIRLSDELQLVPPIPLKEPPNGGVKAWLQVFAMFTLTFNSWGLINSFGVFQSYYGVHNVLAGESSSRISWIGSLSAALMSCGAPFFGMLVDRGYSRYLAIGGTVAGSLSMMMLSLSTKYYQVMLSEGVLTGFAGAIMFLVSISVVAPYFSSRRSMAIAVGATGASLGGVIYSAATRSLLSTVGFPWTCRILGFIILGTGLAGSSVIKVRVPPRSAGGVIAFECFKEPPILTYSLALMLSNIGYQVFYFYYQDFALMRDETQHIYLYLNVLINVGSIAGRVVTGHLADRIGAINVLTFASLSSGVLAFAWIGGRGEGAVIVLALLFGAFSGAVPALIGTIVANLTHNLNRLGVRLGFALAIGGVGMILGGPFAGIMIAKHGGFWAKLYCAFAWMSSVVLLLICRHSQSGTHWIRRI